MIDFWLLYHILIFIIATTTTANVGLQTQKGIIYGRQTQNSIEYLGISYAKIIRWKPPIDLASEIFPNGSFQAMSFGPCCPQPNSTIYIPRQEEQCLNLNIFKPIVQSNHSLLPVFVWIHGGGLQVGCSAQSIPVLYNGTNMLAHSPPDQPVIIITFNYRLGVFGNMFLKELVEENPEEWPTAGNYFYLDMLSALRWIKKNIQDYGGDPTNISLFGESAGGQAVIDLGAVKGSANLYRTAIGESGGSGNYLSYHNMSTQLNLCNSVVQQLNCTSDDKQKVLACLRNISVQDLITTYSFQDEKPIIDDYFFPLYPPLAIQNGTYNKDVNLIMGNNDFEQPMCSRYPNMNSTSAAALLTPFVKQKWLPIIMDYFHLNNCSSDPNGNISRCCDIVRLILMDKIFDCNVHRLYNGLYSKYGSQHEYNKLFWYHINCYPGVCPVIPEKQGGRICRHTSEIPYVFATTSGYSSMESVNCTWDNQSRIFSNEIISHWINTAIRGRPLISWPDYDPSTPRYFHITPDQSFVAVTWNRDCSIFDRIEEEGVRESFGNNSYVIKGTFV